MLIAKSKYAVIGALCILLPAPLFAQDDNVEALAAAYGSRQSVLDVSMSPSGTKLAVIVPGGPDTEMVEILDLTSSQPGRAIFPFPEANAELRRCDWANEEFLVCEAYVISRQNGLLLGFTRMFSLAVDGSKLEVLSAETDPYALGYNQDGGRVLALDIAGEENSILMTRDFVRVRSTGSRTRARNAEGLGVEIIDVSSGSRSRAENGDQNTQNYWADEFGRVRLRVRQERDTGGTLRPERSYYYRTADSDSWELLSRTGGNSDDPYFQPVAVESAKNLAYGFGYSGGYSQLYSALLDGSGEFDLLLGREGTDVDRLIRIGRQRRVVGASYATERRQIEYFDTDLATLADQLQSALPGNPLINIVDASADERNLLIIASSDVEPGIVYSLNRDTNALNEVLAMREPLLDRPMGEMRPVSFPASDGTQIPAYLTLPPGTDGVGLPAIVLPHGGPSARDEWGFDWLVQFLVARGYAVLQPNYRGSSGYGADWFGQNGFQAWEVAIGDVNDAGRWLASEGIADPDRLAIAGWSYGGYAALQSQVLDPDLYKAVIAIAPVTDLARLRDESRRFTSSRMVREFVGTGPHIDSGSPARNAEVFNAPVILFHGTSDQNVGVGQSRLMRDRLQDANKSVEYHEYENQDHQLDNSWARGRILLEIDEFLRESLN